MIFATKTLTCSLTPVTGILCRGNNATAVHTPERRVPEPTPQLLGVAHHLTKQRRKRRCWLPFPGRSIGGWLLFPGRRVGRGHSGGSPSVYGALVINSRLHHGTGPLTRKNLKRSIECSRQEHVRIDPHRTPLPPFPEHPKMCRNAGLRTASVTKNRPNQNLRSTFQAFDSNPAFRGDHLWHARALTGSAAFSGVLIMSLWYAMYF